MCLPSVSTQLGSASTRSAEAAEVEQTFALSLSLTRPHRQGERWSMKETSGQEVGRAKTSATRRPILSASTMYTIRSRPEASAYGAASSTQSWASVARLAWGSWRGESTGSSTANRKSACIRALECILATHRALLNLTEAHLPTGTCQRRMMRCIGGCRAVSRWGSAANRTDARPRQTECRRFPVGFIGLLPSGQCSFCIGCGALR